MDLDRLRVVLAGAAAFFFGADFSLLAFFDLPDFFDLEPPPLPFDVADLVTLLVVTAFSDYFSAAFLFFSSVFFLTTGFLGDFDL